MLSEIVAKRAALTFSPVTPALSEDEIVIVRLSAAINPIAANIALLS